MQRRYQHDTFKALINMINAFHAVLPGEGGPGHKKILCRGCSLCIFVHKTRQLIWQWWQVRPEFSCPRNKLFV
jgi:hypothetical protein